MFGSNFYVIGMLLILQIKIRRQREKRKVTRNERSFDASRFCTDGWKEFTTSENVINNLNDDNDNSKDLEM